MSEKRSWRDRHGCRVISTAYTRDELAEAWHIDGQGHRQALEQGSYCVVVRCTRASALELTALFCRRFAIPTCVVYDGKTISMYCGDAGSGAGELYRDVWRMVADYFALGGTVDENGPLFAQNAP